MYPTAYALVEVRLERGTENMPDSDGQLVRTLANGDSGALETLWDRHSRPTYSLAIRMLRDAGWAEEVVQDVFVRLWSKPEMYDPSRGSLRTWLLTVTHHAATDGLRGKRGTARTRDAGPDPLDKVVSIGEGPEEEAWRNVRAEHVQAALSELPSAQREAIELVYFQGLTQMETAEHMDQPLGTVKSRLRLGLRKLRDSLAEIEATE